jgi:DNA polymerase III delta prime subunit
VEASEGNMRAAILSLQTCKMQHNSFTENTKIHVAEWRQEISVIAKELLKE